MALFSLAAFVGSGGGPAFFGYIPQTIGWFASICVAELTRAGNGRNGCS